MKYCINAVHPYSIYSIAHFHSPPPLSLPLEAVSKYLVANSHDTWTQHTNIGHKGCFLTGREEEASRGKRMCKRTKEIIQQRKNCRRAQMGLPAALNGQAGMTTSRDSTNIHTTRQSASQPKTNNTPHCPSNNITMAGCAA